MGFLDLLKKIKKGETKMSTLDEVKKAYEDLSEDDKKSFHQSISDRVHESIAAQERADGKEDTQSAADREHEALGAEHADGKGEVQELHEEFKKEQDTRDDKQEEKTETHDEALEKLIAKVEALEKKLNEMSSNKLDNAREKYGLSSKGNNETSKEKFTDDDVNKLLG